jgi:hypothetical protein
MCVYTKEIFRTKRTPPVDKIDDLIRAARSSRRRGNKLTALVLLQETRRSRRWSSSPGTWRSHRQVR